MQDSLPAGWLAFTGWELNPLVRDERFPSCYISSPFPGFILTLDDCEHDGSEQAQALEAAHGLIDKIVSDNSVASTMAANDVR
jgi:hypothetical protein